MVPEVREERVCERVRAFLAHPAFAAFSLLHLLHETGGIHGHIRLVVLQSSRRICPRRGPGGMSNPAPVKHFPLNYVLVRKRGTFGTQYHPTRRVGGDLPRVLLLVLLKGTPGGSSTKTAVETEKGRFQAVTVSIISLPQAFFQVLLISGVNATAAAVYVYMQYNQASEFLIVVAQMAWHSAHGLLSILLRITINYDVAQFGMVRAGHRG